MIDAGDLGWLAGVLDSEGAIGIAIRDRKDLKPDLSPQVQMETTCKTTAQRVVDLIDELGVTARSYELRIRNPKHKPSWAIRVTRLGDVQRLARMVTPVAVTKREQWLLVEKFATSRLRGRIVADDGRVTRGGASRFPYTDEEVTLCQRLTALNRRGVSLT